MPFDIGDTHLLSSISQINYAFILLEPDGSLKYDDSWASGKLNSEKNLLQLTGLKDKYPDLKLTLSLGGWNGSEHFSEVARDSKKRAKLISDIASLVKKHKFHGVDIDWEYPTLEGGLTKGHKDDPEAFFKLISGIKNAIGDDGILSAAVPATPIPIIKKVAPYLDYIMLMTYDFTGSTYSDKAYHHSNLYGPKEKMSVEASVNAYMNLGIHPNQIILGVPAYGKEFVSKGLNERNESKKTSESEAEGSLSYYNLCKDQDQLWDPLCKAPYIEKEGKRFITFDNDVSIAEKTLYAINKGLGGIFTWEISQDLPAKDKRSVISTINRIAKMVK